MKSIKLSKFILTFYKSYPNINLIVEFIGMLLPTFGDTEIILSPFPEYSIEKSFNNALASLIDLPTTSGTVTYLVSKYLYSLSMPSSLLVISKALIASFKIVLAIGAATHVLNSEKIYSF